MSLTLGNGPLSPDATGVFTRGTTIAPGASYLERLSRRVRGYFGGDLVVDTAAPRLLHAAGALPQWWLPVDDLRGGLLSPTARTREGDLGRERAWDLHLGERSRADAARDVVQPVRGAADVAGLVGIRFEALDRWLEEDEEVVGHPRDPYHRIDTRRSSDHVVVRVGGRTVAETRRPVKLFETSLPTRWYVPLADVRTEHLLRSDTRTVCAYKGVASYWSVAVGGTVAVDAAWEYPLPLREGQGVLGHLCFLGEDVDVDVTPA